MAGTVERLGGHFVNPTEVDFRIRQSTVAVGNFVKLKGRTGMTEFLISYCSTVVSTILSIQV